MQELQSDNPPMTFDEVSMDRSKGFVKALHELKSLRPQLYSAAEYCESSYLNSEQKEMVMENLKDYAVRALVNAVDHLGTVAYKLTDLFEQQASDLSTMELKVSCLDQQLLTCQTYMRKEGVRQQQISASSPRHHKHYIIPSSVTKKVHFSPQIKTHARQKLFEAQPRLRPAGTPASTSLSWHLASESTTTLKGTNHALIGTDEPNASGTMFGAFRLDADAALSSKSSSENLLGQNGGSITSSGLPSFGVTMKDSRGASKALTGFRSFDNPGRKMIRAPLRNKSMLAAFLSKQRTIKPSCIS